MFYLLLKYALLATTSYVCLFALFRRVEIAIQRPKWRCFKSLLEDPACVDPNVASLKLKTLLGSSTVAVVDADMCQTLDALSETVLSVVAAQRRLDAARFGLKLTKSEEETLNTVEAQAMAQLANEESDVMANFGRFASIQIQTLSFDLLWPSKGSTVISAHEKSSFLFNLAFVQALCGDSFPARHIWYNLLVIDKALDQSITNMEPLSHEPKGHQLLANLVWQCHDWLDAIGTKRSSHFIKTYVQGLKDARWDDGRIALALAVLLIKVLESPANLVGWHLISVIQCPQLHARAIKEAKTVSTTTVQPCNMTTLSQQAPTLVGSMRETARLFNVDRLKVGQMQQSMTLQSTRSKSKVKLHAGTFVAFKSPRDSTTAEHVFCGDALSVDGMQGTTPLERVVFSAVTLYSALFLSRFDLDPLSIRCEGKLGKVIISNWYELIDCDGKRVEGVVCGPVQDGRFRQGVIRPEVDMLITIRERQADQPRFLRDRLAD